MQAKAAKAAKSRQAAAEATEVESSDDVDDEDDEIVIVKGGGDKKAHAWNFFDKTNKRNRNNNPQAKCRTCGTLVTCVNTTNMIKHMRRKHKDTYYVDHRTGEEVCLLSVLPAAFCSVCCYVLPILPAIAADIALATEFDTLLLLFVDCSRR